MRLRIAACGAFLLATLPSTLIAGEGCANCLQSDQIATEVQLSFDRTFTGSYRTGQPHDVLTIDPAGTGDTFDAAGIHLRVRLYCQFSEQPVVGEVAVLFSSHLLGSMYFTASMPTDSEGWTEFHGTMRGGGCAPGLSLFVAGCGVMTFPIKVNSPDTALASPCAVDAGDLSALAARLGIPANYSICSDFNEDGAVDAGDLSAFAAVLGSACNP